MCERKIESRTNHLFTDSLAKKIQVDWKPIGKDENSARNQPSNLKPKNTSLEDKLRHLLMILIIMVFIVLSLTALCLYYCNKD